MITHRSANEYLHAVYSITLVTLKQRAAPVLKLKSVKHEPSNTTSLYDGKQRGGIPACIKDRFGSLKPKKRYTDK